MCGFMWRGAGRSIRKENPCVVLCCTFWCYRLEVEWQHIEYVFLKSLVFLDHVSNSRLVGPNAARQVILCGPWELRKPYNTVHVAEFPEKLIYYYTEQCTRHVAEASILKCSGANSVIFQNKNIVKNQIINNKKIMLLIHSSYAARNQLTHGPVPVRVPGVGDHRSIWSKSISNLYVGVSSSSVESEQSCLEQSYICYRTAWVIHAWCLCWHLKLF